MTSSNGHDSAATSAILSASLTMLAILIAVVGILLGQIVRWENVPEVTRVERRLIWAVVGLMGVNAWCAFWSLWAMMGRCAPRGYFEKPMLIQPWITVLFVVVWVGFKVP